MIFLFRVFTSAEGDWTVYITTGEQDNAGVEANVSVTVYGDKEVSQALPLGEQDQPTKMEQGQTQEFKVGSKSI